MFEYRVTKYAPSFRDPGGAYRRDEWTSFEDIGRAFDGKVLTAEHYQGVEDAYVATALSFLREAGQPALFVRGLERSSGAGAPVEEDDAPVEEGGAVPPAAVGDVIRGVLRGSFWCRLEG